jgi:predicted GNAT superfamily acetyltransferase
MEQTFRNASTRDYARVSAVVNDWWGWDAVSMLPRLFFEHFADTSFVVEQAGTLQAFLIGFRSQSRPLEAYIHFVGVAPEARQHGLARALYERFFADSHAAGCRRVGCVTGPGNRASVAFHRRMGFEITTGDQIIDGIAVHSGYDGAGRDRVVFQRAI